MKPTIIYHSLSWTCLSRFLWKKNHQQPMEILFQSLFMVTNWKSAWNLTSVLMLLTSCACLLATIISCMLIGQRKPFTRLVTSRFQCDKSLTRHTIYFDKISQKNPKHLTYVHCKGWFSGIQLWQEFKSRGLNYDCNFFSGQKSFAPVMISSDSQPGLA